MISLKILGTNGLYPSNGINNCGYYVNADGKNLLLDIGSGVFAALKETIAPEKIDGIFISHLHFDHISDIGIYNYYLERLAKNGQFNGRIKVFIKKSESAVYRAIARLNYFETVDFNEGDEVSFKDLRLSFFRMRHIETDYAVMIKSGNTVLSYLGDTNVCDNLEKVISKSDSVIYHAPFDNSQWNEDKPHLSIEKALSLAKKHSVFAICSHFLPDCDMNFLKGKAAQSGADYVFAKQGETYEILPKNKAF